MAAAPQQSSSEIGSLILEEKILQGYGRWVYLNEIDACVCVPNKNGGVAFRNKVCELRGWDVDMDVFTFMLEFNRTGDGPFSPRETRAFYFHKPHYLSVRDPVNRFASLWRNKCRDIDDIPDIFGKSPHELMDYIEEYPHGNSHWFRQSGYLTSTTQCIAYDRLFSFLGWTYKSRNATKPSAEDMPADRILDHYADDLALWEGACSPTNIAV